MKFRVRAYGQEASDTVNNNQQCSATLFGGDSGPINAAPSKRSAKKERKAWMKDILYSSNWHSHTGEHLCSHPNSYGPDFVGSDGYFCDMETKTLTPLCSTKDVDGCVEVDNDEKAVVKRSSIARRTVRTKHKAYKKITAFE